jgi:diacylglycerol O-acyltransferase
VEQLQGLDSLFIRHETEHAPLHVLAVMRVSRKNAPHPITAETFRRLIAARITDFPGLCKKIVEPPIPLAPPLWIRTKPDLRIHIREVTMGEEKAPNDFDDYLALIDAELLDRSRPLWELHIVHDPTGDDSYLVAKGHHALLDGIAGFELMANIFDLDENGANEDLAREVDDFSVAEEIPDWTTHIGATLVSQPITWAQSSIKVARNALNLAKSVLEPENKPSFVLPWRAPSWPENRTLTSERVVSQVSLEKTTIKALRQKHSASFHDVFGAITAGALRNVLLERGELPDLPLACVSPVSIRRKRAMHGNELAVMFAQLPTHLEDPFERIEFMKSSFSDAKEFLDSLGQDMLGEISRLTPWSALGALWNLYSDAGLSSKHAPFSNVMLSSLPGPNFPMYCAGSQVLSAFPYGPLFDGSFLNITAISYLDKVNCGLVSCPESIDYVATIASAMTDSCDELALELS